MVGKLWTKEEIEILKNHYGKHFSRDILLELLPNRTYKSINMQAFLLGLKGDPRNSNRKYKIDFNSFKKVNKNSAYWAGFIAADGHITIKNQLVINLSAKDKEHIIKLREFIKFSGPIHTENKITNYGGGPFIGLAITCRDICNDLNNIFNIPKGKKSDSLSLPKLQDEYLIEYIAGYFDGDGCLYSSKQKYLTITFVGNKEFLNELKLFVDRYFKISTSPPYKNTKHSEAYLYRIHGHKAYKVLMRFAKNTNSMSRKRLNTNLGIKIGDIKYDHKGIYCSWNKEEIEKLKFLYSNGHDYDAIVCQIPNRTKSAIQCKVYSLGLNKCLN